MPFFFPLIEKPAATKKPAKTASFGRPGGPQPKPGMLSLDELMLAMQVLAGNKATGDYKKLLDKLRSRDPDEGELATFELQQLMTKLAQMQQTLSNIIKKSDDQKKALLQNIRA